MSAKAAANLARHSCHVLRAPPGRPVYAAGPHPPYYTVLSRSRTEETDKGRSFVSAVLYSTSVSTYYYMYYQSKAVAVSDLFLPSGYCRCLDQLVVKTQPAIPARTRTHTRTLVCDQYE